MESATRRHQNEVISAESREKQKSTKAKSAVWHQWEVKQKSEIERKPKVESGKKGQSRGQEKLAKLKEREIKKKVTVEKDKKSQEHKTKQKGKDVNTAAAEKKKKHKWIDKAKHMGMAGIGFLKNLARKMR